jgi:hypothetical protein
MGIYLPGLQDRRAFQEENVGPGKTWLAEDIIESHLYYYTLVRLIMVFINRAPRK